MEVLIFVVHVRQLTKSYLIYVRIFKYIFRDYYSLNFRITNNHQMYYGIKWNGDVVVAICYFWRETRAVKCAEVHIRAGILFSNVFCNIQVIKFPLRRVTVWKLLDFMSNWLLKLGRVYSENGWFPCFVYCTEIDFLIPKSPNLQPPILHN